MKKLYLLLIFILGYIATASATTLNGALQNPDGSGFTGTLYLSIAQQVGISSLGSCGGPVLVVPTEVVTIPVVNGAMTGPTFVYGGDCTLPAGMPYNAVLRDQQGNTVFTTMWLITGATQNVGTIYAGPATLPANALNIVPGVGTAVGQACSANSMYLQTDASGGAYLQPCVNGVYAAQGGTGGGSGMAIGSPVASGIANAVLFVDGSGNLAQDATKISFNSTTHVLTVANAIVGSITGNANTSTSLASTPSTCTGSQVAYGINAAGNAQCKTITYADLGSPPGSFPVSSVFGRVGAVLAAANDYSFSMISGTVSPSQLVGSGAITAVPAAGVVGSDGTNLLSLSTTGSGGVVVYSVSPVLVTPDIGNATATSVNNTPIQANAVLMDTTTVLLAAQMPVLTGDVTNTLGSLAMTVGKLKNVPFCTGFTPTTGQGLVYTTASTPNPCYTAQSFPQALTLKVKGVTNSTGTQNLQEGANILLSLDASGNVIVGCPNCANPIPLGISMGVDWPPTITSTMNDEFTSIFNLSNIWTVVNQGTSTIADTNSLLSVNVPAHSGDSFVGIYQAEPSRPFEVGAKIALTGEAANAYYGGLAFRDSGTGLVVAMRYVNGNNIKIDHWASATSLTSTVATIAVDKPPAYMFVKDDGTNFIFYISNDGVAPIQVYQESRTAYLASPDQVGYMAGAASTSSAMALGSDWFRRIL